MDGCSRLLECLSPCAMSVCTLTTRSYWNNNPVAALPRCSVALAPVRGKRERLSEGPPTSLARPWPPPPGLGPDPNPLPA